MDEAIIIGSGPAAAGAALALSGHGVKPRILDIGTRLEEQRLQSLGRIRSAPMAEWDASDLATIAVQPVKVGAAGLPEKRAYGSDFPFREVGQLKDVTNDIGVQRSVVSSAVGGFSNTWGAQLMPFSSDTFNDWPVTIDDMAPHYQAILREVPFSGVEDDLAELFPLFRSSSPLPHLSERTRMVLSSYAQQRDNFRSLGITLGQARLAATNQGCLKCGLCMTGCPQHLVYSAADTFARLQTQGCITYTPGKLAVHLDDVGSHARVTARDLVSGRIECYEAKRIFVGCGAFGSSRLVAGSLQLFDDPLFMDESAQFTVPMISIRGTGDPRETEQFALNQFNMIIELSDEPRDLSQVHFYTYNDAFVDALPRVLRHRFTNPIQAAILKRLTVAIGYLPSWHSPRLRLQFGPPKEKMALPPLHIGREASAWRSDAPMAKVRSRLYKAGRLLDLHPLFHRAIYADGAKSYHFGGSFAHGKGDLRSDRLGRIPGWNRIHLIDGSVFPSVPATTFTFTVMANAHRIASETENPAMLCPLPFDPNSSLR